MLAQAAAGLVAPERAALALAAEAVVEAVAEAPQPIHLTPAAMVAVEVEAAVVVEPQRPAFPE